MQNPRCTWCESDLPGRRGFRVLDGKTYHLVRYDCVLHPLHAIFMAAAFTRVEGMNWLQDRGLIADECVDAWQVAIPDLERVIEEAAFRFNPAWLRALMEYFLKKMQKDA